MSDTAQDIAKKILSTRKYKGIDPVLVQKLVAIELQKSKKQKDVEKEVKSHLHQIYGSFSKATNFNKIFERLKSAHESEDQQRVRGELIFAMQAHASSGERIPILDDLYQKILNVSDRIVDVACGLNPLSIVYLGFPKTITLPSI